VLVHLEALSPVPQRDAQEDDAECELADSDAGQPARRRTEIRLSAGHMGTDDVGEFDDEPQSGAERNDADHKAADRGRQSLAIVRGELADSCNSRSACSWISRRHTGVAARVWRMGESTEKLFTEALADQQGIEVTFELRVLAAAVFGAFSLAISTWVDGDGDVPLPALIQRAFDALTDLGAHPDS
jgi:hypothetical protein